MKQFAEAALGKMDYETIPEFGITPGYFKGLGKYLVKMMGCESMDLLDVNTDY